MRRGDEVMDKAWRPSDHADQPRRLNVKPTAAEQATGIKAHGESRKCETPGCRARTTQQKPFCIDHLENMPYFAQIKHLAAQDDLDRCCSDILSSLSVIGVASLKKLRQEAGVKPGLFQRAIWRLTKDGRIETFEQTGLKGHAFVGARLVTV